MRLGPQPVVARAVLGHTETTMARTRLRARAVANSAGWDTVSAAVRARRLVVSGSDARERKQCRSDLVGGEQRVELRSVAEAPRVFEIDVVGNSSARREGERTKPRRDER